MNAIAIITARGGSKRIPHKNVKNFCGRPIISYSIQAALKSGIFEEVMVSTDNQEIAEIAKANGAAVPFLRSAHTANDFATTADVLAEVIRCYTEIGRNFRYICCIYPVAPFLTAQKLKDAMELLVGSDCESVMPVVQYSHPPQRAVMIEKGRLKMQYPQYLSTRTQDLQPLYHDCGQFYCMKTAAFLEQKSILMENTKPIVVSEMEVQDVDTLEDWALAEMKFVRAGNPAPEVAAPRAPLLPLFHNRKVRDLSP